MDTPVHFWDGRSTDVRLDWLASLTMKREARSSGTRGGSSAVDTGRAYRSPALRSTVGPARTGQGVIYHVDRVVR